MRSAVCGFRLRPARSSRTLSGWHRIISNGQSNVIRDGREIVLGMVRKRRELIAAIHVMQGVVRVYSGWYMCAGQCSLECLCESSNGRETLCGILRQGAQQYSINLDRDVRIECTGRLWLSMRVLINNLHQCPMEE